MTFLPTCDNALNKLNLIFGLNVHPFAPQSQQENEIPKVIFSKNNIFKCTKCGTFINNKFKFSDDFKNQKRILTCNICEKENILDPENKDLKKEYFYKNISMFPELVNPSVDFILDYENFQNNIQNDLGNRYIIFLIDISDPSIHLNFSQYVLNSIQSNLEQVQMENNSNIYIGFITFDSNSVQSYYIDKRSKDIKMNVMTNVYEPFNSVPEDLFFIKYNNDNHQFITQLTEKIMNYSNYNMHNKNKSKINLGSAINASIFCAYEIAKNFAVKGTTKILAFSSNKSSPGIFQPQTDDIDLQKFYSTQNETKLFLPMHENNCIYNKLHKGFLDNRITFFLFHLGHMKNQLHMPNFNDLCNITGGQAFYYGITDNIVNFKEDLKTKLEKMHYDLNRILTRKEYLDVEICLKHNVQDIEISDIFISGFNKFSLFLNSEKNSFKLSSISQDFNFMYNLKFKKYSEKKINLQIIIKYSDPILNSKNIRTFNCTLEKTTDYQKIFSHIDTDTMTRVLILKELSVCLNSNNKNLCAFDTLKENLMNKMVETIYVYKMYCSSTSDPGHLVIPSSIKFMLLYLCGFFKKPLLRKIKNKIHPNVIANVINLCFTVPLNIFIKMIYPKFYRLDDIKENYEEEDGIQNIGLPHKTLPVITKPYLYPLSLDNLDLNMAFVYDDGFYINLIILSEISELFIYEVK